MQYNLLVFTKAVVCYTAEMGVDSAEDRETILAQIYELFNPESDGYKNDNMEGIGLGISELLGIVFRV